MSRYGLSEAEIEACREKSREAWRIARSEAAELPERLAKQRLQQAADHYGADPENLPEVNWEAHRARAFEAIRQHRIVEHTADDLTSRQAEALLAGRERYEARVAAGRAAAAEAAARAEGVA